MPANPKQPEPAPSWQRTLTVGLMANVLWFACVWPAAEGWPWQGLPWLGPVAVLLWAPAVLSFSRNYLADVWLCVLALVIGLLIDGSLLATGLLVFPETAYLPSEPGGWLTPVWMLALWMNFALCLPVCFRWLIGRVWLAAVLGFVSGPLAYFSGQKLGALTMQQTTGWWVLAVLWAIAMAVFAIWLNKTQGLTTHLTTPDSDDNKNRKGANHG